ncbi:MAG: hypothetical protein FWC71_07945 [Defluviitaleaceae bacterium]|nr:hypothetical protein [Defluviitaleaceae bacterium]
MRKLKLPGRKKTKTEKLTINLTPTEVGQIDYLVERGLYTNRSDFIRMAIRKQTESHAGDISQFLAPALPETDRMRYYGGLGLYRLTRAYIENLRTFDAKVNIRVVGALSIEKTITAQNLREVMASCKVHGKLFADEEIKTLIKEMNAH